MAGKKYLIWTLPLVVVVVMAVSIFYFLTTPTFSHEYNQLTERVEVGLKYTNPDEKTVYFHPYIENPNTSNLTLTHRQNFIEICVLDKYGNVLENAVLQEKEEDVQENLLQTTLSPGEREKINGYYKITFPPEAKQIQLTFQGKVEDEFGTDDVKEIIEVNIDYLKM